MEDREYLTLLYLELLYKIIIFGFDNIFNVGTIIIIISLIPTSMFFCLITKMFQEKINKILTYIITFLICFWYGTSVFVKVILDVFFSISHFAMSEQIADFTGDAIYEIFKRFYVLIALLIPLILLFVIKEKINFSKQSKKRSLKKLFYLVLSFIFSIGIIFINAEANKLVFKENNFSLTIEKLGINIFSSADIYYMIFGYEEKLVIPDQANKPKKDENVNEQEIIYKPNTLNIDFNAMNQTNDKKIKQMNEYFSLDKGTLQNEYTGLYKGKNLIYVVAESLSDIAITEEFTPTLYKMANESFVFNNFYTPVNNSTAGGEFQALMGLFAEVNMLNNRWKKATNKMPYGLGNMYKKIDYNVFSFHNGEYYFQSRNKYLPMIGFDSYLACGNGIEKRMKCNPWPRSDEDMVLATIDDYVDKNPFITYYMSNSGHSPYTSTTTYLARKNYSKVKDLPYSQPTKIYISYIMDLDQAMASLIKKLEEKEVLDDTVIVIVPDHYPYRLTLDQLNEPSKYERDNIIEKNRNTLIIWNNKTEKKIINKIASQLDVLPTVYNLFGLEYDSRLFMGKDILSSEPGLVFFQNRSWVTDEGKYFTNTGEFIGNEIENKDEYIKKVNVIVRNRINMSKLIMEKDYYGKIKVK